MLHVFGSIKNKIFSKSLWVIISYFICYSNLSNSIMRCFKPRWTLLPIGPFSIYFKNISDIHKMMCQHHWCSIGEQI